MGTMDRLGMVVISMKQESKSATNSTDSNDMYRVILRMKEVSD